MASAVKIISTEIDAMTRRVVKFLRFGRVDVQTSLQAGPYGADSNPIKDMVAVYSETSQKGRTVVVGYINTNQLAGPGEHRIFSTNAGGDVQTFVWLRADGTMQIGGNADNAVRFSPLDNGLQAFKTDIQAELVKIQTGITGAGGSYTPATLDVDISGAKIDEIKTP